MFRPVLPLLLILSGVLAASPSQAALAAWKDASRLPPKEAPYYRYLWWPASWTNAALLTRAQQNLLSDQGDFAAPAYVGAGVYRLDTRESGWDKRLQVWEKFAAIDFVFHVKWEFVEDGAVTVYFPPGVYDGQKYGCTVGEQKVKKGDRVDRPAPWANPYAEVRPGVTAAAYDELRRLLCSEAPLVSGPFFFVRTARQVDINNTNNGVGYYEWFGIKNRNDYFDLVGLDEKTAIKRFAELRAVIDRSGISEQNRQVILLRGATGITWGTLDTFKEADRGIARRNLRRNEFDADAEEYIGHLPNGLPVNALIASKDNAALKIKAGDAQASAPDQIGPDDSPLNHSRDMRVHVGVSCWRCHGVQTDYVRPFDDWARRTFRPGNAKLLDPDKKVELELRAYLRDLDFPTLEDRRHYARAVQLLTHKGGGKPAMTVAGFSRLYAEAWNRYVSEPVTLEAAAEELGVHRDELVKGLVKYNEARGASDNVLSEFLERPPGTLRRLAWESSYALAQVVARGIQAPEIVTKVKAFDTSVKGGKRKGVSP